MKLPEVIVLGGVELRRVRNTYSKWEDEWTCAQNWNRLERRKKKWQFDGGPLNRSCGSNDWYGDPHTAYIEHLRHLQRWILAKRAEEMEILERALGDALVEAATEYIRV